MRPTLKTWVSSVTIFDIRRHVDKDLRGKIFIGYRDELSASGLYQIFFNNALVFQKNIAIKDPIYFEFIHNHKVCYRWYSKEQLDEFLKYYKSQQITN